MPSPQMPAYEQRLEAALAARRDRQMLRALDPAPPASTDLVDFSSNDYISFAQSQELRLKLLTTLQDDPEARVYGPPSSRLLDGNSPAHAALERRLAQFFAAPSALLFNSGFDANVGLWTCLADREDWIVFDELVHASMHDGMRGSRVPAERRQAFRHNSVSGLARRLEEIVAGDDGVRLGRKSVWVGVESLYSMDGDLAPLNEIVETVERLLPRGNGHVIVDEVRGGYDSSICVSLDSKARDALAGTLDRAVRSERARSRECARARTASPSASAHIRQSHGLQRRYDAPRWLRLDPG